jgi:hypothetical protein
MDRGIFLPSLACPISKEVCPETKCSKASAPSSTPWHLLVKRTRSSGNERNKSTSATLNLEYLSRRYVGREPFGLLTSSALGLLLYGPSARLPARVRVLQLPWLACCSIVWGLAWTGRQNSAVMVQSANIFSGTRRRRFFPKM